MTTTTPFTYLIGWSRHNLWYYGVRFSRTANPSDLWTTYFTSSKKVRAARLIFGEPDIRQVRRVFSDKKMALIWEHTVLRRMGVKHNTNWLNDSVGLGDKQHIGPWTDDMKSKISATKRRLLANGTIIPKKHTEEHKQKLRENNPGGKATAKPICQVDSTTGVVTLWKSARAAGVALGVKQWRNISTAVRNPHQTVGGFYWRWPDDSNIVDGVLVGVEELNSVRCDNAMRAGKQVQQLDTEGNLLTAWKNMSEASRGTGIKTSNISSAVKSGKKAGGYYWKLK